MKILFLTLTLVLIAGRCGNQDVLLLDEKKAPSVVSATIAEGQTAVPVSSSFVDIVFGLPVKVKDASAVTMSGAALKVTGMNLKVRIAYEILEYSKTYTLVLPSEAVVSQNGDVPMKSFSLSFTTEAEPEPDEPPFKPANPGIYSEELVTENPLPNARRLYKYLLSIYGRKTLSGAMAKVAWNTAEADWVHKWTGKYPAIATFDYIHLKNSPSSWIDYSDISVVEAWFKSGGIVGACWHWKVPASEKAGINDYSFYSKDTKFKVSNIFVDGSWEKRIADADLEKIASYIKLLQNKNIPVLWRPLHEAAGNTYTEYHSGAWFWWGKEGGLQYVKLWKYMFNFFKSKGINNLIWIWTTQTSSLSDSDYAFYPGDEFVDIVGRDIYNIGDAGNVASQFSTIASMVPKKMVALSENGGVPDMKVQWEAGAKWLFFMPWYDYSNDGALDYGHEYAGIGWWKPSLEFTSVINRDGLPLDLYK